MENEAILDNNVEITISVKCSFLYPDRNSYQQSWTKLHWFNLQSQAELKMMKTTGVNN